VLALANGDWIDGVPRAQVGESEHDFRFDRVFPSYVGQDAIFDQIGAPMVDAVSARAARTVAVLLASIHCAFATFARPQVMSGINGAVIAYGQTGSGKTFTMEGGEGAE